MPDLLARLKAELPRLYPGLLIHAVRIARRTRWASGSEETIAQAAKDVLQEAVLAVADGTRKWDPERVDLERFLKEAMRSIASNRAANTETKRTMSDLNDTHPAPSNPHLDYLSQEACAAIEAEALAAAGDDPELELIVTELIDGNHKPRDIAEATGLAVEKVYTVVQRFRRRLDRRRS